MYVCLSVCELVSYKVKSYFFKQTDLNLNVNVTF